MYKPVYPFLLAVITYYGCQKGIEDQPSQNSIDAHQWRLSGYMYDTTKYGNWDVVDYAPEYYYDGYYCLTSPVDPPFNGETYLSFYKCTIVKDNIYYFLPDSLCDWNRQPVLTDTSWNRNIANDIIFNTNGDFNMHISAEHSKWIDENNSTCSNFVYHPYEKSDYGYTGTWQLDSATNIITLTYQNQYGVYDNIIGRFPYFGDTTVPRTEKWKVINMNDAELSLNACLTCPIDSGFRQLYKAF